MSGYDGPVDISFGEGMAEMHLALRGVTLNDADTARHSVTSVLVAQPVALLNGSDACALIQRKVIAHWGCYLLSGIGKT